PRWRTATTTARGAACRTGITPCARSPRGRCSASTPRARTPTTARHHSEETTMASSLRNRRTSDHDTLTAGELIESRGYRRCGTCGRIAGAAEHDCPTDDEPEADDDPMDAPLVDRLQEVNDRNPRPYSGRY